MPRPRRALAPRSAALAAVLLAALAAAGAVPAPAKVKAQFVRLTSFAPLAIAREEGFFRAEGLDVELVEIPGIGDATPALLRGELDVAAGLVRIADFNAIARGATLRLVADKGHSEPGPCPSSAIAASPAFLRAKEPGSAAHLRGARVSTPPLSLAEFTIERFLSARGLGPGDVTLTRLQQSVAAEALSRGALDLAVLTEPDLSRAVAAGKAVLWKPVEEVVPGAQLAALAYGPSLLERDRGTGRKFMAAYLRGVRQYNLGKTERNLAILAAATGLDRELLKASCWQAIRGDGRIDVGSVLDFQRWAVGKGALDAVVPPERFLDPSFAAEAVRALGTAAP